jgi:2-keto-4-pentenoate hydratase/2-oxohepta-3-ene-1,7-dioic acid hydratase in catechol pathway
MGMRITRFLDERGEEHLGVDRGDGTAECLQGSVYAVAGRRPSGRVERIARRLAPVAPANIYCIGLNYRAHARESQMGPGRYPTVFMKPTTAVVGPGEPIRIPASTLDAPEVDYECELAVVIGRACRDVDAERALEYVLGYTCANDVSARHWQMRGGGGQWIRGKSFDTFCPLGPVLVTPDELGDPQGLGISTRLNGAVMQESTTADMVFPVAELIAFLCCDTTLAPGTVILTGTPSGVGFARKPPVFLKLGDRVAVEVERIGTLENPVA